MTNKIWYITNSRFPTEKAHGVQIALNCCAMLDAGADLTLFVPDRRNQIAEAAEKYYGLDQKILVKKIWTLEIPYFDRLFFLVQSLTFYIGVFFLSISDRHVKIFTRDNFAPPFIFNLKRVVWEIHELPKFFFGRKLLVFLGKRCQKIIAVNQAVETYLIDMGLKNVVFLPNATDLDRFRYSTNKQNKSRVVYMGSFYRRKGADILITAAKDLHNVMIDLYGGPSDERERLKLFAKQLNSSALIHGQIPYYEVPKILGEASVLVIPNSGDDRLSSSETLPLKMVEYLATNKPIVASLVPSLKYFENYPGIFYFQPDNPKDLARAILLAKKSNLTIKRNLEKFDIKLRAKKIMELVAEEV